MDIRTVGLTAGIDLAPVADAPGKRGFAGLNSAFHDSDLMVRVAGDTLVLTHAADHYQPDRRDHRGRQGDPRDGVVFSCDAFSLREAVATSLETRGRRRNIQNQPAFISPAATIMSPPEVCRDARAFERPAARRNRTEAQPDQAGDAIVSAHDRTNQASGTITSYAVAAGLLAVAGIFLIAACLVGATALFRWIEIHCRQFWAFGAIGALLLAIAAICAGLAAAKLRQPSPHFPRSPAAFAWRSRPIRSSRTRSKPHGTPPRRSCWRLRRLRPAPVAGGDRGRGATTGRCRPA